MGKITDAIIVTFVLAVLIAIIFVLSLLITNYINENKKILEPKKDVADVEVYKQVAIERIMNDNNYKELNGYNLVLISDPDSCGEKCYSFSFEYNVNQTKIAGLSKIISSVVVENGDASNFSISEVHLIKNFKDCLNAGFKVYYPGCTGCSPYCTTNEGKTYFRDSKVVR